MLPDFQPAGSRLTDNGPKELDLLYRISQLVHAAGTSKERFLRAMEVLDETFGANYGTLTLLNPSNGEGLLEVAFGEPTGKHGYIQGPNRSTIEEVLTHARPMAFSRVTERPLPFPSSSLDEKDLSLLCIPIVNNNRAVGVITTHPLYRETVSYDKDIRLMTVIAHMVFADTRLQKDLTVRETKGGPPLDEILDRKLRQMIEKVDPRTESRCALLLDIVNLVEKIVIKWALRRHQNVQTATALFLGINRNTLRKKMRDLNIHF
jgi:transcriptional regulator with GAF, ATPase, and Fis domain